MHSLVLVNDFATHCNLSPQRRCHPPAPCEFWPSPGDVGKRHACLRTGPSAPPPRPGTPAVTRRAPAPSLWKMLQRREITLLHEVEIKRLSEVIEIAS